MRALSFWGRTRFAPGLRVWCLAAWGLLLLPFAAPAVLSADEVLPPEQAFRLSARIEGNEVKVGWEIADGYYLYRDKFRFGSETPGITLATARFEPGEFKHDEFFGTVEIYRKRGEARIPWSRSDPQAGALALAVAVQGCADAGICYPPFKRTFHLTGLAASDDSPRAGGSALSVLGLGAGGRDELLPADRAFQFLAEAKEPDKLRVSWRIADGYFLYRDKFRFELKEAGAAELGAYELPHGVVHEDPEFGTVEILKGEIAFDLPIRRPGGAAQPVRLTVFYQGCAERGVCYPPMHKEVALTLPEGAPANRPAAIDGGPAPSECEIGPPIGFIEPAQSEQCQIANSLERDSVWWTALSFLGMGLLLAFTPCIFPMIPILSGIIVGHGGKITTTRAFLLSLSYVVASALAYTVFGIFAGLFGANLQALLQDPRIIGTFAGLFVLLALSMFGFYELQIPNSLQTRISLLSNRQGSGTLTGAALMGVLSALIVGPCVAAPLAGALIYISQTGDAVLGGIALFALGMGMGLPLLVIGASAGRLLPRAGPWMNAVKAVFGVGMLAVAVWLLERILPPAVTMFLWALLLIIPAIFLGAMDSLPPTASGWRRVFKGLGIVMLAYGVLLLIGVASNSTDPLQPLRGLALAAGRPGPRVPSFKTVASVAALDREISAAGASGRWVMLDFYADWCVSCQEMERYTYTDERVRRALADLVLLKADVTANGESERALLRRFGLVGPPATLFFGPDRDERKSARIVGYLDAEDFLNHLKRVLGP